MTPLWIYPSGALPFGAQPAEVMSPAAAWLLVFAVLAIFCTIFWLLGRPLARVPSERTAPPSLRRARGGGRPRSPWAEPAEVPYPLGRPPQLAHGGR